MRLAASSGVLRLESHSARAGPRLGPSSAAAWAVAVGHDHIVLHGDGGDRLSGHHDIGRLNGGFHGLTSKQKRIPAQCDDDSHAAALLARQPRKLSELADHPSALLTLPSEKGRHSGHTRSSVSER